MYCQINEQEAVNCECRSRCCRLYDAALAFIAAIILLAVGLIVGARFADTLLSAVPILITAAVILAIVFIVTLLTRGCCKNNAAVDIG